MSQFFRYGKKAGYLSVALLVLAVLPLVVASLTVPAMASEVPMKIAADGEVLRYGSRFELLLAPGLCLLLSLATLASARKQAGLQGAPESLAARAVYTRYARNGVVTAVVLNVVSAYLIGMVLTGHGLGF